MDNQPVSGGGPTSTPGHDREHAEDSGGQIQIDLLRRRFEFLENVSELLASSLDFKTTLANVANLASPGIADWCAIDVCSGDYCDDPSELHRIAVSHVDPAKIELAYDIEREYPPDRSAPSGTYNVVRTGRAEFYREIPRELLLATARDERHMELIVSLGLVSAMLVPLNTRGRTLGVLSLVSAESGRLFEEADLHLAEDLACRAAMAIDNAILFKRTQQAEEALRERLDFTNAMMASVGEGILALDRHGTITYANPAAEQLLGWPSRELVGRRVYDLVLAHRADGSRRPEEESPLRRVTAYGESSRSNDDVFTRKDGALVPVAYTSAPIVSNGSITGAILAFHDISEQKRQERELEAQREWFHTTLSSIGDAVIATDTRGSVTFLNRVAEKLTGWSSADAIGCPLTDIFTIVDYRTGKPTRNPVDEVLRTGAIVGLADGTLLIGRDGSETPIDDSAAPIRNERGEVLGVILVFHDITERKRSEDALRRSNERRTRLLESIGDAFIALDRDWRFTYANRRAQELFGPLLTQHIELVGAVLWAEFPDLIWTDMYQKFHAAVREQAPVDFEVSIPQLGGWFAIHAYPSLDGLSIFLKDVNERKRIEGERAHLLDEAQGAERRFNELIELIRGVIWEADPETFRFTSIGERAGELFGYRPDQWLEPDFWVSALHPEDREAAVMGRRRSANAGRDHHTRYRMLASDGRAIDVTDMVYVVTDADGRPVRLSGVMFGVEHPLLSPDSVTASDAAGDREGESESSGDAPPADDAASTDDAGSSSPRDVAAPVAVVSMPAELITPGAAMADGVAAPEGEVE